MYFRKFEEVAVCFLQAALIAGITIFAAAPFSCKVSTEGIQIVGGDYTSPVIEDLKVLDEKSLKVSFSKKVKVTGVVLSPYIEGISDSSLHSVDREASVSIRAAHGEYGKITVNVEEVAGGNELLFRFGEATVIGMAYELYGLVEDLSGNSLTFCLSFTGFNPRIPSLLISEVQIKYAKASLNAGDEYRSEFVEILALEDGNLSGLRIVSACDGEKKAYDFPGIEVHKDEVIIVHLRNAGEGCINELDDNLNAAKGTYSADGIRDLWAEENAAHFHDYDDVIIIEDKVSGKIIDGIMYSAGESEGWKERPAVYAKRLFECGLSDSCDISAAIVNKGTTPKNSLQRNMNKHKKWEVAVVTPGILKK